MRYITAKQIKEELQITTQTLYNWRQLGKIDFKEINCRNFIYDIDSVLHRNTESRKHVIYCRVSNTKQKDDLHRQEQLLRGYVTSNGKICDMVYSDIASGMNENRKGLNLLISDIRDGKIDTVYITFKDRLTRFGFGYLESMFGLFNTKIVILNATTEEDFQTELSEDIISIIHYFSMKMYSSKRSILKNSMELLKHTKSED